MFFLFFFFNDTATTEIYTLSLHDALPISRGRWTTCCTARSCARRTSRYAWLTCPSRACRFTRHNERGLRCRRRSEEHTSELQSQSNLVCRLLLEKKKTTTEIMRVIIRNIA